MFKMLPLFFFSHFSNPFGIDKRNDCGETALITAAREGDTEKVLALIGKGANVNARNWQGHTPLLLAVERGCTRMALILIANGADINDKDYYGHTHLMRAVWRNDINMTLALIANGADVNAQTKKDGMTPLMQAVKYCSVHTFQVLLDNNADVNIKNRYGKTVLDLAVENGRSILHADIGHFSFVEMLQQHGVDISPVREFIERYAAEKQKRIEKNMRECTQESLYLAKEDQRRFNGSPVKRLLNNFKNTHDETKDHSEVTINVVPTSIAAQKFDIA